EATCLIVGLWRSWERASMAWKRSSVRSRPGPPNLSPCQRCTSYKVKVQADSTLAAPKTPPTVWQNISADKPSQPEDEGRGISFIRSLSKVSRKLEGASGN